MTLESLKKDVTDAIDAMRAELLGLSHVIHQEPELALEEFKAAERLAGARISPRAVPPTLIGTRPSRA